MFCLVIKHCKIILGEQFFHRDTLETKLMEYLNTLIYQHKCCDDRVEKRNDESRIEFIKTQPQLQGDDPACPNYYRPQRKCEGYVFTPVFLSTVGGGLPHCMLGYPPRRHPPGREPPLPQQTTTAVDGTHPTGMHSCGK